MLMPCSSYVLITANYWLVRASFRKWHMFICPYTSSLCLYGWRLWGSGRGSAADLHVGFLISASAKAVLYPSVASTHYKPTIQSFLRFLCRLPTHSTAQLAIAGYHLFLQWTWLTLIALKRTQPHFMNKSVMKALAHMQAKHFVACTQELHNLVPNVAEKQPLLLQLLTPLGADITQHISLLCRISFVYWSSSEQSMANNLSTIMKSASTVSASSNLVTASGDTQ